MWIIIQRKHIYDYKRFEDRLFVKQRIYYLYFLLICYSQSVKINLNAMSFTQN